MFFYFSYFFFKSNFFFFFFFQLSKVMDGSKVLAECVKVYFFFVGGLGQSFSFLFSFFQSHLIEL